MWQRGFPIIQALGDCSGVVGCIERYGTAQPEVALAIVGLEPPRSTSIHCTRWRCCSDYGT